MEEDARNAACASRYTAVTGVRELGIGIGIGA